MHSTTKHSKVLEALKNIIYKGFPLFATVLANRKFTRIVNYTIKHWFSAWPDRRLKCCHILDSLAPIWYWLEICKKVRHVFLPQGIQKLQDVKVESPFKVYFCAVNQTLQTLTGYNFGAPWGTKTCLTFLKTSNQYLYGARLPRGL